MYTVAAQTHHNKLGRYYIMSVYAQLVTVAEAYIINLLVVLTTLQVYRYGIQTQ